MAGKDKTTAGQKDQVYHETLIKLGRYIEENYAQEGFLPSENKMSDLFGVSRSTYRSALASFSRNGFIQSFPKRGHRVTPKRHRIKKVGLVVGEGRESPFIGNSRLLGRLIESLEAQQIYTQIIQSTVPEKITWRALAHGVSALVWLQPPTEYLPLIVVAESTPPFPQLIVKNGDNDSVLRHCVSGHYVLRDSDEERVTRIRFLLDRGHHRIAFMSNPSDEARFRAFFAKLPNVEYDPRLFINMEADWEAQLRHLITTRKFTALMTSHSAWTHEKIFGILNPLPQDDQPELLLPNIPGADALRYDYPKLKLIARSVFEPHRLANAAADILSAAINDQQPMKSKIVNAHRITLLAPPLLGA